jgi:aminocarboxymuconate-semialdehyde decarboxylase
MRNIDMHAHIAPAAACHLPEGQTWHGFTRQEINGRQFLVQGNKRQWLHPAYSLTADERIAYMESVNIDMQVLTTWVGMYNYDLPGEVGAGIARECNDYVAELTRSHPDRFVGMATLPMQDVSAAIAELERSVNDLGLKGAQIADHINNRTPDHEEFLPFWAAVEELGALILFHQEGEDTVVMPRDTKGWGIDNSIGNPTERVITFGTLVFGGVLDRFPDLKICLSHGGGYTSFGAGRLDRGWQVRSEARALGAGVPSTYLNKIYYDSITHSEDALRYLIDAVGIDRVFLGSDYPYDMGIDSPAEWVNGMESLTQDEKDAILWKNLERVLGV